ncbi:hypothetical protein ACFW04_008647 [Cataglyphis niger]
MIPEFDGTSRHKLQEFLNACTYTVRNISPADKESLMQAILYTKLKGKAMDFETRDIQMFEELKHQLETCYQTRQSTTHLQIEFNSLKQKLNETAHSFGQRVDLLVMKLYNSMKGEEHPAPSKPDTRFQNRKDRINTINKYCKYCKKSGHNREECWSLNGRPRTHADKAKENNKKPNEKFAEKRPPRQFKRNLESNSNSSMEEKNNFIKKTRPAAEYRVTHIKEAPRSTISLIKLKHVKDYTPIQEEKIALTGVTGHKIYTVGKMYGTIRINNQKVKQAFYVVRDDIPIEYKGILGIDFLRQHSVTCDYKYNRKIGNAVLNLHPFNKIILKPRIVRAEEKAPGVYIGNCIVNTADYTCPVSVINTIDREALLRICENFCDIFHVDGEPLTCIATVEHEINTRIDTSPVNVRPYRLSEKHKTEVNKQVQQMLKDRIIRTSTSQWNAPLLVLPKKADASGKLKLRVVIDFRKLNDLTIGDSFPLPNITDILDQETLNILLL